MIGALLPAAAVAVEAFDDAPGDWLLPAEEATLGDAVDKRRREFTTGRRCAREAMARLGFGPQPLLPGPRNEPQWPAGLVGSITHCAGYRAAVVARATAVLTLGIDAEPNEPLPTGILGDIALPQERSTIADLRRADPSVRWDRLLFSAKESVYKAWFPLARRWLGFYEAIITIDPATGTFRARLLVSGPALTDGNTLTGFTGRWCADRDLVLTAIAMPTVAAGDPHGTPTGAGRTATCRRSRCESRPE